MPDTGLTNQIRASFHSKAESWIHLANVPVIRKLNNVIRKLNKMSCSFIGLSIHIVVVTLTLSNFMNTSNNYTITDHRDYNIMHNELQTQVILKLNLYNMWHHTTHYLPVTDIITFGPYPQSISFQLQTNRHT